jgi:hypothetical protein
MANLAALFGNKAFNPLDVEEMEVGFAPVPKGIYSIIIADSELAANKSGTGTNMTLKLIIQEGKSKGRTLFDNLCVVHKNEIAQRIAQTRMKQICTALGIGQVKDTSQFHDKPLRVSVDVELDEYGTNKRNDGEKVYRNAIKAYEGSPAKPVLATAVFDLDEDMPF